MKDKINYNDITSILLIIGIPIVIFFVGCQTPEVKETEQEYQILCDKFNSYDMLHQHDRLEALKLIQSYLSSPVYGQLKYSLDDMKYGTQVRNMLSIIRLYQTEAGLLRIDKSLHSVNCEH